MTTMRMIAERAGVSVETVSRVLNGRYRQSQQRGKEQVERVQAIARELGYRANAAARTMQTRRTLNVGVVLAVDSVSRLAHAAAMETILGINAELSSAGYVMSMVPVLNRPESDGGDSRALRERVLDGVVLLDELPERAVEAISDLPIPCIWVNHGPLQSHDGVGRDERRAGALCIERLADLGYRDIVYVDRENARHFSFAHRLQGVTRAMGKRGLRLQHLSVQVLDGGALSEALVSAARKNVAFAVSDVYLARRLHVELTMAGLCAGRDYALACCDDSDELKQVFPHLARVTFDRFTMGAQAARMMLSKLQAIAPGSNDGFPVPSITIDCQWQSGSSAPGVQRLGGLKE